MKAFIDRLILALPVSFLKQYPFAWIASVVLLPRSLSIAAILWAAVLLGMLALRWQTNAWISHVRRQYAQQDGKFYIDQPPIPWRTTAPRLALLVTGSLLLAILFRGELGFTFWQFFLLAAGVMLFFRDTLFFGAAVTYIITASGIAIRYVPGAIDYCLFLSFREISRIERRNYTPSLDTNLFARMRDVRDGLLMTPKDPKGFTNWINKLFIAPTDVDRFVEQLPYGFG